MATKSVPKTTIEEYIDNLLKECTYHTANSYSEFLLHLSTV
jgi:hypothetical protein